ncbi:MAG: carboxylesterase family protein [Hyphomonadaceae bacterium]|nr:carboxylesterase family protein [Hyphomonadaceae bacterium]
MKQITAAAIGLASLLWLSACSAAPSPSDPASNLNVATVSGAVEGVKLATGVRAWFGVPFAAPPVGDLRWKAPQLVKAWDGVRHTDQFAPDCMQPLRVRNTNHWYGAQTISEDCLYLNVWAPAEPPKEGETYPVVVWIFGGGFNIGSANTPLYGGEQLAAKGVVYVGVAYRVGALGFLAHPELTAESGVDASGNYGLMDQIAGLQWVKNNIAAFGGDPSRVTIMGQSAGSASVAYLQQSPLAKGLVHGVVGMSGAPFGVLSPGDLKAGEADGLRLQTALKATNLAAMRDVPPDRVLQAQSGSRPIIDGHVLTASSDQVFAAKQQYDVPVLIGFTSDEGFAAIGGAKILNDYRSALAVAYGADAGKIEALYPAKNDAEVAAAARSLARDSTLGLQMNSWARNQAANGTAPSYAFYFSRAHSYLPGVTFPDLDPATAGAYHTADVPFWLVTLEALNSQRPTRAWTDDDRAMAERMSNHIVNFARTGNPNATGDSAWPKYAPDTERVMSFGASAQVIDWPNRDRLQVLRATPPRPPAPATASARPRD